MRISASDAIAAIADGATLVDIRSPDEYAREHVPGSRNIPQERLGAAAFPDGPLIFTCQSGNRTAGCEGAIARAAGERARIVAGGLNSWKAAGGTVESDPRQPLPIMRQVQITAGTLVLAGVLLSLLVHPGFIGLSAFVGAGLTFAGVSGWCGMANILQRMPWNRVAS